MGETLLPWEKHYSKEKCAWYYWHPVTEESTWYMPSAGPSQASSTQEDPFGSVAAASNTAAFPKEFSTPATTNKWDNAKDDRDLLPRVYTRYDHPPPPPWCSAQNKMTLRVKLETIDMIEIHLIYPR